MQCPLWQPRLDVQAAPTAPAPGFTGVMHWLLRAPGFDGETAAAQMSPPVHSALLVQGCAPHSPVATLHTGMPATAAQSMFDMQPTQALLAEQV